MKYPFIIFIFCVVNFSVFATTNDSIPLPGTKMYCESGNGDYLQIVGSTIFSYGSLMFSDQISDELNIKRGQISLLTINSRPEHPFIILETSFGFPANLSFYGGGSILIHFEHSFTQVWMECNYSNW